MKPTYLAGLALAGLFLLPGPVALASGQAGTVEEGRKIAEERCGRCHAVGAEGQSTLPIAPPFRTLHEKYPVESLEEALAEGITVGHQAMPEFEFTPEEITALLGYIETLSE